MSGACATLSSVTEALPRSAGGAAAPALSATELAGLTGGRLLRTSGRSIRGGAVDSRLVEPGNLFVALPGERTDGHRFLAAAVAAGASALVVSQQQATSELDTLGDVTVILVRDGLTALGAIAAGWRRRFNPLVVGVTGSIAKTSTKEAAAAVLGRRFRTLRSEGNQNNEIGLPLTLLRLTPEDEAAVLEMGMYVGGEIADLAAMAQPRIGVVTAVQPVHLSRIGTIEAVEQAKGELVEALPPHGTAVLNADDPLVAAMAGRTSAMVLHFGLGPGAEVRAEGISLDDRGHAHFELRTPGGGAETSLPAPGEHLVPDALAAAAAGHALGLEPEGIAAGLGGAALSPMRMQVQRRADGLTVINDAYNANPASMAAALKALMAARGRGARPGRTVALLGEMAELGEQAAAEHDRLGRLATRLGVDRLVGVGELGEVIVRAARMEGMWPEEAIAVPDAGAAVAVLDRWLEPADVVLVKASRVVALDEVAERLLSGEPEERGS